MAVLAAGWRENKAKADKFVGEKSAQSHDTQGGGRYRLRKSLNLGLPESSLCLGRARPLVVGWDEPWPPLEFAVTAV